MTNILYDIYLVDGSIDYADKSYKQALDSSTVYEPVINNHGYTQDEFTSSVKEYVRKPQDISDMLSDVKNRLMDEKHRLEIIYRKEQKLKETWEVAVQARAMSDSTLKLNPRLRAIRWIVFPNDKIKLDLEMAKNTYDNSPVYSQWWEDNIRLGNLTILTNLKIEEEVKVEKKKSIRDTTKNKPSQEIKNRAIRKLNLRDQKIQKEKE